MQRKSQFKIQSTGEFQKSEEIRNLAYQKNYILYYYYTVNPIYSDQSFIF